MPTGVCGRAGILKTLDDLIHYRCIRHRPPGGKLYRREFERGKQILMVDPPGAVILDDERLIMEVAVGIAYVAATAATVALKAKQLH